MQTRINQQQWRKYQTSTVKNSTKKSRESEMETNMKLQSVRVLTNLSYELSPTVYLRIWFTTHSHAHI